MNKSETICELAKAMCSMQLELENATKSTTNPFFKAKYADLAEVLRCIKGVAMEHGLSFTQMPSYIDGVVSVETMLMHSSGEWIVSTCSAPASKLDPQGIGSAITYLRRYSLAAVFGLAQEDDDGNSQRKVEKKVEKKVLTPADSAIWAKAKAAYMRDGNFNSALERVEISEANMQLMMRECNNV